MRLPVLLLLAILLIQPVLADGASPYIIVVREDAPSSDVVFAANFAAAMRSQQSFGGYVAGVTFDSSTDKQLYEAYEIDDLRKSLVVLLDVEEHVALAVIGDGSPMQTVITLNAATHYLTEKGFTVILFMTNTPWQGNAGIWDEKSHRQMGANVLTETYVYDGQTIKFSYDGPLFDEGHVVTMEDLYLPKEASDADVNDDEQVTVTPPSTESTPEVAQEEMVVAPAQEPSQDSAETPVTTSTPGDEQGLFSRIWSWLAGFFD